MGSGGDAYFIAIVDFLAGKTGGYLGRGDSISFLFYLNTVL